MKINVAEILPGDTLMLADGSFKTAASARAVGVGGPIEVMWKDGATSNTFPRDAEIQVIARLHMVVPTEMEEQETAERIAAHIAWTTMGHGKETSMTDGYARASGAAVAKTLNPFAEKGGFKAELEAFLSSSEDHANGQ